MYVQGVAQLLQHLTPLVQQGNLVEQLEDVIDDKTTNEVSVLAQQLCSFATQAALVAC